MPRKNNHSQKKILFIVGTLGSGGAERRPLFLINEITQQSAAEVHLAMLDDNGNYMPYLSDSCARHHIIGPFPFRFFFRLFSIVYLLYRLQPDAIYTNLWGTAHLIQKALLFYTKPVKFIYGISNTLKRYQKNRKAFEQILADEQVTLVLQTERVRSELLLYRESGINIHVIPNVIDPGLITSQISAKQAQDSKQYRLIHVGRISPAKRHDRLLDIIAKLDTKGIDFHLDIVGGATEENLPLLKAAQQKCQKNGLENVITFHGFIKNPFPLMAQSDLILLTSDYEGMPMVLIEALTLGVPIVSTDIEYGPREIVDEGNNGFIVEKDDTDQFVSRIVEILNDLDAFKKRAYASSERFHVKNHIHSYLNLMGIPIDINAN